MIIGVAGAGQQINTRPLPLVTGLVWRRSAFGAVRGRNQLPGDEESFQKGEIPLDPFITLTMELKEINRAFELMHKDESIRSVVHF